MTLSFGLSVMMMSQTSTVSLVVSIFASVFGILGFAFGITVLVRYSPTPTPTAVSCCNNVTILQQNVTTLSDAITALTALVATHTSQIATLQDDVVDLISDIQYATSDHSFSGAIDIHPVGWGSTANWGFNLLTPGDSQIFVMFLTPGPLPITLTAGQANPTVFGALIEYLYRPVGQSTYLITFTLDLTEEIKASVLVDGTTGNVTVALLEYDNTTIRVPSTLPAGLNGKQLRVGGENHVLQVMWKH